MKRRSFIKKAAILSSLAGATGLYSWQIEPFWLEFVRLNMPIKNLPKHLNKKTLIHISDIHVGNRFDLNFLKSSLQKAQKFNPDFVVYTGDYVSYENSEQYKQLADVMQYTLKGKYGTFGILGNHDYGVNWKEPQVANKITSILSDAGIQILRNEQEQANGINFIGIDELYGTNFQPEKIMPYVNHKKANITLCHNPDVVDFNVWGNYKSWILSGHTHGGQCKAPFLTPPILPVKNKTYVAGKYELKDGRTLYINRALGHLYQVRFNVRPEITVFTLESC